MGEEREREREKGKERENTSGVSSSFYEDTSSIRLGPIFMTSCNLNYLLRAPISKYSHIGGLCTLQSILKMSVDDEQPTECPA